MAVTTEHYYTGNASTTSFAYTFPYYKTSDIKVTWDGVLKTEGSHYNVTGTNVVFTSGNVPANNVVIRIYRDTDVDTSKATFAAGNSIRATDLNNNQLQLLYSAQERQSSGQVNANISAKAEIDVSKLKDGTARQVIQTAANGTDVEWTSNIDVPGTLDVTGATTLDGGLAVTGNITVSGNVDGRNVSTDGTKLDGIEANATADQTGAQIKTAYENESNTNAYTDAEKTKLAGIATGANVTDANTVNSAGAVMNTDLDGKGEILIGDGNGDPTALAVGSNNFVLTADSNEATGVKWAASSAGEDNQNAFSNVAVSGQDTVAADTATDTLTLVGGSNVTLTTSAANDSVTIAATNTQLSNEQVQDIVGAMFTGNTETNITATYEDSDGTIDLVATDANTTYATSFVDSSNDCILRLTPSSGSADDVKFVAGSNITLTPSGDNLTIAASGGEVTVQDEGNALTTAATTLNFTGAGVTASGSGATKTITISGSGTAPVTTDFQRLELKAHNNASGAFSAGSADYELVTKGTTTPISPTQAAALIISVGGVIQEPNTGTSIGSNDGFCIDGSSIHFGANLTEHPDFIVYLKGAGEVTAIADDAITTAKILDANVTLAKLEHGTSGTNGKFLRSNNGADPTWEVPPDTQLSTEQVQDIVGAMFTGNTETNITATYEDSDGTIDLVASAGVGGATGVDFNDNVKARFGTGNDLEIYHNGTDSFIDNVTGNLNLRVATNEVCLVAAPNAATYLYYDASKKLETTSVGAQITGRLVLDGGYLHISGSDLYLDDNRKAYFGASSDLKIYHDGNNSLITNATGQLVFRSAGITLTDESAAETYIACNDNGSVDLYHDNVKKFETASDGISLPDKLTSVSSSSGDYIRLYAGSGTGKWDIYGNGANLRISDNDSAGKVQIDRAVLLPDDVKVEAGSSSDLQIWHDGSHSNIKNTTGDLKIDSNNIKIREGDGADTHIKCLHDGAVELYYNGSKKLETYADGVYVYDYLFLHDNDKLICGHGSDLQIWHDGSHSYVKDNGTGNLRLQSDSNIWIEHGAENMIVCNGDAAVELYYDNAKKLETQSHGVNITDGELRIGDASDGNDALIRLGATGTNVDTHAVIYYDKSDNYLSMIVAGESHGSGGVYVENGGIVRCGAGIKLGGTAADNVLDDYEEGTWTASYAPASGSYTMLTTSGKYTKIGRFVMCTGSCSVNGGSSPSGLVKISGLPFTVAAVGGSWNNEGGNGSVFPGYNFSTDMTNLVCIKNSTTAYVFDDDGNGLSASDINTGYNEGQSSFTFTYTTSA